MQELQNELTRVVKYFNYVNNNVVEWKPNGRVQTHIIKTDGYTIQFDRNIMNGTVQMYLFEKLNTPKTILSVLKPLKKDIYIDNKIARAEAGKLLKFKINNKEDMRVSSKITADEIFNLSLMHSIEINIDAVTKSLMLKKVADDTKKFIQMNLDLDLETLKKTVIQ